ncbi:MAG: prolipoprotein diacylglyceryl transferase [Oscillospiraceae bacterium]
MSKAAISFPMLGDFSINPSNYITIGNFKIYWYGIIIAAGFLLAVIYASKRAKQFGLTPDNILDVIILGVPLAIIGARIYYVVSEWEMYADNPISVLYIWEGGLGMYGVLAGAIIALIIYAKHKKLSILAFLDLVCIGFLIGQFIGRWGNFMNREAYGYETDIFCRMGLTLNGETIYVHPTFLYESLWNFIGFLILHFFSKKHRRYDGQIFLMYLAWYGFGRMFIEGLRTDSLYIANTGIRKSQLVACVSFLTAAVLLMYNKFKVHHDPADMFVNRKLAAEAASAEGTGTADGAAKQEEAETENEAPDASAEIHENSDNNKNHEDNEISE